MKLGNQPGEPYWYAAENIQHSSCSVAKTRHDKWSVFLPGLLIFVIIRKLHRRGQLVQLIVLANLAQLSHVFGPSVANNGANAEVIPTCSLGSWHDDVENIEMGFRKLLAPGLGSNTNDGDNYPNCCHYSLWLFASRTDDRDGMGCSRRRATR